MAEDYHAWRSGVKLKKYPPLEQDLDADVVIIGGGITGVTSAYLLAKAGKKVALLEKDKLGGGATDATTAFLTQVIDTDLNDLIKMYGPLDARRIYDSHAAAISCINRIIESEKIDCDFVRCPNYVYANTEEELPDLEQQYRASRGLALPVELYCNESLNFPNRGYIAYPHQAKFHPIKYLTALTDRAQRYGAEIFENTEAENVIEYPNYFSVQTTGGEINASWVIAASYEPFKQPAGLFFKKGMYTSYVLEARIPAGSLPEAIYEDLTNPYHYFRVDNLPDEQRIIIGGADHRADIKVNAEKHRQSVEDYLKNILVGIPYQVKSRWEGPILEPVDGLAFIGPQRPGEKLLYAFGFSGNGMTYSTIAAEIFADTITVGKTNLWADIYRADRLPRPASLVIKVRDYLEELWNGVVRVQS